MPAQAERITHNFGVPYRGLWRQTQPYLLPADALWDCKNVLVRDGVLLPRPGYTELSATVFTGTPTGLSYYNRLASTVNVVLGTTQKLYVYESGTWTESTGAATFTATNKQLARFATLVIAGAPNIMHVNGVDAPRVRTGAGNFALVAGTPPTFADIAAVNDHFVGLVKPYMVRWGNARSVTVWPSLNFKELAETPDRVVSIAPFGQSHAVIYKQRSTWLMAPTGEQTEAKQFRFEPAEIGVEGPAGPAAVVDANGVQFRMTPTGRIGLFNGTRTKWIADAIWPFIRADINTNTSVRVTGWYDSVEDEVWFIYPSLSTSSTMRGVVVVTPPRPEAGVDSFGAFWGLLGSALNAACPVVEDDHTTTIYLASNQAKSYTLGGTTDNGTTISGYWQTGLVQAPAGESHRFEGIEVFAARANGYGKLTVQPVTAWTLANDGTLGDTHDVSLVAGDDPVEARVGLDARGRFLGLRFAFADSVANTVRYKGAALYTQKKAI